jgi:hypothetical protein
VSEKTQRWFTAEEFGELFDVSARHLRRLGELGLPSRKRGRQREYPLPDALVWMVAYLERADRREEVQFLSLELARAEYRLREAWAAEARPRRKP